MYSPTMCVPVGVCVTDPTLEWSENLPETRFFWLFYFSLLSFLSLLCKCMNWNHEPSEKAWVFHLSLSFHVHSYVRNVFCNCTAIYPECTWGRLILRWNFIGSIMLLQFFTIGNKHFSIQSSLFQNISYRQHNSSPCGVNYLTVDHFYCFNKKCFQWRQLS